MRACGMMYKAVYQSVLLYGSDSWVVTGEMLKFLEGFHHQVARRITEYPPLVAALEAAGLHPTMEYIRRRQINIAEKLACLPIYELYVEAERRPGTIQKMRWWD